MSVCHNLGAVA